MTRNNIRKPYVRSYNGHEVHTFLSHRNSKANHNQDLYPMFRSLYHTMYVTLIRSFI